MILIIEENSVLIFMQGVHESSMALLDESLGAAQRQCPAMEEPWTLNLSLKLVHLELIQVDGILFASYKLSFK